MNQGADIVLIGQLQRPVVLVSPMDRLLQCIASVKARGTWIRIRGSLGFSRRLIQSGPLVAEEIKIRHGLGRSEHWVWERNEVHLVDSR